MPTKPDVSDSLACPCVIAQRPIPPCSEQCWHHHGKRTASKALKCVHCGQGDDPPQPVPKPDPTLAVRAAEMLAKLEPIHAAMSPVKWFYAGTLNDGQHVVDSFGPQGTVADSVYRQEDATGIAELRNALPTLLQLLTDLDAVRDRLERAAPLCEHHANIGKGARSSCPHCADEHLDAALSRISYLCGKPNEMECGPYDVDRHEPSVIREVERVIAERDAARRDAEALAGILASVRWSGGRTGPSGKVALSCPYCHGVDPDGSLAGEFAEDDLGHRPDCKLIAALAAHNAGRATKGDDVRCPVCGVNRDQHPMGHVCIVDMPGRANGEGT
jgi:hypothetical protein